jgi:hypothetical protein
VGEDFSACFRLKGTRPLCCSGVSYPSDHAEPRNASRCRACLAAPRFLRLAGSGSQGSERWTMVGAAQTSPTPADFFFCGVVGPVILPSHVSCHWPEDHNPAPHVTQRLSLRPNFSNINRALRPLFRFLFFFFSFCGDHTLYKHPRVARILAPRNHHGHCSVSCGPEQTYCKTGISYQLVHREAPSQGSVVVLKLNIPIS